MAVACHRALAGALLALAIGCTGPPPPPTASTRTGARLIPPAGTDIRERAVSDVGRWLQVRGFRRVFDPPSDIADMGRVSPRSEVSWFTRGDEDGGAIFLRTAVNPGGGGTIDLTVAPLGRPAEAAAFEAGALSLYLDLVRFLDALPYQASPHPPTLVENLEASLADLRSRAG